MVVSRVILNVHLVSILCPSYIPLKMRWLLKLSFDKNPIMINHKSNDDFKSYITLEMTQYGHKKTCSITRCITPLLFIVSLTCFLFLSKLFSLFKKSLREYSFTIFNKDILKIYLNNIDKNIINQT